MPWILEEEAIAKQQILDQSKQIKSLQHQLDEAIQAMKSKQSQEEVMKEDNKHQ